MKFTKKIFLYILILGIILIPATIWAINSISEGWRVVTGGGDTLIDVWSDCQVVTNTSGADVFVPTKTDAEWQAFQSHLPTGVTASGCVTYTTYNLSTPINDTGYNIGTAVYAGQTAVIRNYLYIFGGWGASGPVNTIQWAEESVPYSWANAGGTLPDPLAGSQLAYIGDFYNGYVYLFGGNHGTSYSKKIYRAPVSNPNSAWSDTGATLPSELCFSQLAVIGNTIYLFGGYKSGAKDYIWSAPTSDPTNWSDTGATLPVPLSHSSLAVIGDYVYLFGGNNAYTSFLVRNVFRAPISDPTSWSDLGVHIPSPGKQAANLAIVGDYIYLFGGHNGTDYNDDVFRAPISDPISWTNLGDQLPGTALGHSNLIIYENTLYLLGGYTGGISNNVNAASITSSSVQGAEPPDTLPYVTTYNPSWKVKANE